MPHKIIHRVEITPISEAEVSAIQPSAIQVGDGVAQYGWEGIPEGVADAGINLTVATVQNYVPNIQPFQTFPQTKVNPVHEQGWGRAPGWQMGWMHKYEPKEPLHYRTSRARRKSINKPEHGVYHEIKSRGSVTPYRHARRTVVRRPGINVTTTAGGSLAGVKIPEPDGL